MRESARAPRLERGGMSLYQQVSGLLLRRLEAGEWTLGDQIPTIDELMAQYGVSRITMRRALSQLEEDGLVQRGRGRGTFVTGDATRDRWLILPTEWDSLVGHIEHLNARVEVLHSGRAGPPTVPSGVPASSYWHTRRVNFSETAPYSLTDILLAWDVYSKAPTKFSSKPILPLLAKLKSTGLSRASQILEISTADVETAKWLRLDVGAPIAEVQRLAWDVDDRLIYRAHIRYPGRHLRIDTNLMIPGHSKPTGLSRPKKGSLQ